MSRTSITLPADVAEEFREHIPDDMTNGEFVREVVLPLLEDADPDVQGEADLDAVADRLERLEGRLDDLQVELPTRIVDEMESRQRR